MSNHDDLGAAKHAIGREIAAQRTRRSWTQNDLAEFSGVSKRQVGKIERGEAGQLDEVLAIANALGISFAKLFADAEAEVKAAEGRRA